MSSKQFQVCAGGCLTSDMRIALADGSTKPISKISVGENLLDGQRDVAQVRNITWGIVSTVVCLTLENGSVLSGTPTHPVLTENGFKPIGDLHPGNLLQGQNGPQAVISTAVVEHNDVVFNLALERSSTMICEGIIVGDAGTQSALSH